MTRVSHSAGRASPSLGRLWFGIAAAPVAWSLAELIGYALAAQWCEPGAYGLHPSAPMAARLWQGGVALVAAVVAAIGLYVAITNLGGIPRRQWPQTGPEGASDPTATKTRVHFMAVAGILASAVFLLGTVLFGFPAVIVNVCAQTR